ncbi:MAG: hypothetical protein QM489_01700 [Candidatus Izemoplasma sp.]
MLSKKNVLYITLFIQIAICLFIFQYEFLNIGPVYFQAQLYIVVLLMFLTKLLLNKDRLHVVYNLSIYKFILVLFYPIFLTILIMYSASVVLYTYEGYFDPVSSTAIILFGLFPLFCIFLAFRKKIILSVKYHTYTIIIGLIMYLVFLMVFRFTDYALNYYLNVKIYYEVINLSCTFLIVYYMLFIYKLFYKEKVTKIERKLT